MPARQIGRAFGTVALAGLGYGLYTSQRTPAQSAALKNPLTVAARPLAAIAVLQPDGGSGVTGTVQFRQDAPGEPTHIKATVQGLKDGMHGFHVHQVTTHTDRLTQQHVQTAALYRLSPIGTHHRH